jgi:hypothetical protein
MNWDTSSLRKAAGKAAGSCHDNHFSFYSWTQLIVDIAPGILTTTLVENSFCHYKLIIAIIIIIMIRIMLLIIILVMEILLASVNTNQFGLTVLLLDPLPQKFSV